MRYTENYANHYFHKSDVKITFTQNDITNKEISAEKRRNLFLCTKEALNNILKHSEAKNVNINFHQEENHFTVTVSDDGKGFIKDFVAGNGLANMKTRMKDCAGEFKVLENQKGTVLQFILSM